MSLAARLGKAQAAMTPSSAAWRELLTTHFAAPVYDAHRAAIIETLCGPKPFYQFQLTYERDGQPWADVHIVSWPERKAGRAPDVVIISLPEAWAQ